MAPIPSEPIVVKASATNDQMMTALRDLAKIAGSALAMKGVIDGSYVEPGVGALFVLAPVIWSQFVTRANHVKLWVLARAAPDHVGQAEVKK